MSSTLQSFQPALGRAIHKSLGHAVHETLGHAVHESLDQAVVENMQQDDVIRDVRRQCFRGYEGYSSEPIDLRTTHDTATSKREAESASQSPQLTSKLEANSASQSQQLTSKLEANSASQSQQLTSKLEANSASQSPQLTSKLEANSASQSPLTVSANGDESALDFTKSAASAVEMNEDRSNTPASMTSSTALNDVHGTDTAESTHLSTPKPASAAKELKCKLCPERFVDGFLELQAHTKEQHNRYVCRYCFNTFTQRVCLKRHEAVHCRKRQKFNQLYPDAISLDASQSRVASEDNDDVTTRANTAPAPTPSQASVGGFSGSRKRKIGKPIKIKRITRDDEDENLNDMYFSPDAAQRKKPLLSTQSSPEAAAVENCSSQSEQEKLMMKSPMTAPCTMTVPPPPFGLGANILTSPMMPSRTMIAPPLPYSLGAHVFRQMMQNIMTANRSQSQSSAANSFSQSQSSAVISFSKSQNSAANSFSQSQSSATTSFSQSQSSAAASFASPQLASLRNIMAPAAGAPHQVPGITFPNATTTFFTPQAGFQQNSNKLPITGPRCTPTPVVKRKRTGNTPNSTTKSKITANTKAFGEDTELQCQEAGCGESSMSFSAYQDHCIQRHLRYPCHYCMQTFSGNNNRTRHENSHKRDKEHQCPDCDKRFSRPDSMREHQFIHTLSYQEDKCRKCGATFDKKNFMLLHLKQCYRHKLLTGVSVKTIDETPQYPDTSLPQLNLSAATATFATVPPPLKPIKLENSPLFNKPDHHDALSTSFNAALNAATPSPRNSATSSPLNLSAPPPAFPSLQLPLSLPSPLVIAPISGGMTSTSSAARDAFTTSDASSSSLPPLTSPHFTPQNAVESPARKNPLLELALVHGTSALPHEALVSTTRSSSSRQQTKE